MILRRDRKLPSPPEPAQSGMTLIEMLVVLTIIGVTASLALLSIGVGGGASGQNEAKRLESRLQLAADQSMLRDEVLAVNLTQRSYNFVQWDEAMRKWVPTKVALLEEVHELPSGITLASANGSAATDNGSAATDNGSAATDNGSAATDNGSAIVPLDVNAAAAPLEFTLDAGRSRWTIGFDGLTAKARNSLAKSP